jgi:hypothetical protein
MDLRHERVEHAHPVTARDERVDEVRPYEARTARDKDVQTSQKRSPFFSWLVAGSELTNSDNQLLTSDY